MRVAHPCSQDVSIMQRVPGGLHCGHCDRDVIDLRRVPRKRALAVISETRASEGRVCVRVRASEDGMPLFAPDPPYRLRLAAPALVATVLAACGAAPTEHATTPISFVAPTHANASAVSSGPMIPAVMPRSPVHPASNGRPVELEMLGEMSF